MCGQTRKQEHLWTECNGHKCSRCGRFKDLTGKTVVAAPHVSMEPNRLASEDDRSFFCISKVSDSKDTWDGFWLADGTRGTTDAFLIEDVLAQTPAWAIAKCPRVAALNLERWQSSGHPGEWVSAHLKGWNHQDLLDLLASLRKTSFWPMEESAIDQYLESLRAKAVEKKVRDLLSVEDPVVYPQDHLEANRDEPAFCASNFRQAVRSFGNLQSEARDRLARAANFAYTVAVSMTVLSQEDLANLAQNAKSKTVREAAATMRMGILSTEHSVKQMGDDLSNERR